MCIKLSRKGIIVLLRIIRIPSLKKWEYFESVRKNFCSLSFVKFLKYQLLVTNIF